MEYLWHTIESVAARVDRVVSQLRGNLILMAGPMDRSPPDAPGINMVQA